MISIKGKVQKIGLLTGADSKQPYLHQFLTYLLRFFWILFPMIKECFSGHLVHSLAFPTSPTSMLISDANPSQGATQPPEDRRMAQRVLCANDGMAGTWETILSKRVPWWWSSFECDDLIVVLLYTSVLSMKLSERLIRKISFSMSATASSRPHNVSRAYLKYSQYV